MKNVLAGACAAFLAAAAALTPLPASADDSGYQLGTHGPTPLAHWGHGHAPRVCVPDRNLWRYTAYAEWGWSQTGYPNGFRTGPDSCRHPDVGITVAFDANLDSGGRADVAYIRNSREHLHRCDILIRPDLGHEGTIAVLLHEYGHCLGLDHTTDPEAVMHPFVGDIYASRHDYDAMVATYRPHTD